MKRLTCAPRQDWQKLVEEDGLVWHNANGQTYWLEGVYYAFTPEEIHWIDTAKPDLYDLVIRLGDASVSNRGDCLDRVHIPLFF